MKNKNKSLFGVIIFFVIIGLVWFFGFGLGVGVGINKIKQLKYKNNQNNTSEEVRGEVFFDNGEYPVMVVFDNHPDSRLYQCGFSKSVIVYEYLVEGGSTRFAGLYSGPPDAQKIGPVRSARPYSVEIASGWSALFMHAGGSPEALDLIKGGTIEAIDLNEISGIGAEYFFRDSSIVKPHNLFTSGELMANGLKEFELSNAPSNKILLSFESEENKLTSNVLGVENVSIANSVYIDFSEGILFDSSYEYDQTLGLYKRSMAGLEHKDSATGEQIVAANIIIQRVPQEDYYPSGEGRIKLEMAGEGEAMLFQNGKMAKGTWKKADQNSQTEYFDKNGVVFVLKAGQTWIEIVPGDRVVSFE